VADLIRQRNGGGGGGVGRRDTSDDAVLTAILNGGADERPVDLRSTGSHRTAGAPPAPWSSVFSPGRAGSNVGDPFREPTSSRRPPFFGLEEFPDLEAVERHIESRTTIGTQFTLPEPPQ
jgi:hypothetical protein